jgi:arylsulfatase
MFGCGEDSGAPVSPDYGPVGNHFNGEVKGVQLSIVEGENEGKVVDPKDRCTSNVWKAV